jgi:two-component system LytT family sensor kinase
MKQFKSFLGYWLVLSVIMFSLMLISQKNILESLNKRIDISFFIFTLTALICFSLIYIYNYVKKYKYNIIITLFLNFILGILHSSIYQIILEKNIRISTIMLQASLATVILFALLVLRKYKLLKFSYVEFNFGWKQNLFLIGKSYLFFCLILLPFFTDLFYRKESLSYLLKIFYFPIISLFINYFLFYFSRNIKIINILKIVFVCFFTYFLSIIFGYMFFDVKGSNFLPTIILFYFPSCFLLFYVFNSYTIKSKLEYLNVKKTQEYQELKNQINPHFLFNNLNTMISFIEENPMKAIAFGHHLAGVYRHYLKNSNEDFISLIDELSFIQNYLDIYKAKFNNSLEFTLPVDILKSDYIMSSVLQEIIDNIFKHNIIDAENIMKIDISKEDDFLVIANSKVLKNKIDSTKMGLNNISKRYELLTNQKLIINDYNIVFEVQIPILKYED